MEKSIYNITMKNVLWILSFLFVVHFSSAHANKALSYDANSNVTKHVTLHAGEISCSYDPVNRLTGINYPDGRAIKYAYDCNDNLIEVYFIELCCIFRALFKNNSG